MKLHFDKFTIIVLVVVGVLLAAAVFTISRTNDAGSQADYVTDDTPSAPVVNAFIALQNGDIPKARAQYSAEILKRVDSTEAGSYGPLRGNSYGYADTNRRLRVLKEQIDDSDPDRAYVTVAIDNYTSGGLFNSSSTWSTERVVEVVREDGAWKINGEEYFY